MIELKWGIAVLAGLFVLYVVTRLCSAAIFRSYFEARKRFLETIKSIKKENQENG